MNHKLLLPNKYKVPGWILLIPSTIYGIIFTAKGFQDFLAFKTNVFVIINDELFKATQYFTFANVNVTPTIAAMLFIAGALLVSFSKEKREDEFIANLRLSSLLWAVLVNYIVLFFAFAFVYGNSFFNVMVYNIFTVLIIFIARFNYLLYKNNKAASDEK